MAKKVLITGAGGFIGGFIVQEALNRGYETWAAVRATTAKDFLTDERINFLELDFTEPDDLHCAIETHVQQYGKWDYVVHNLGATKCANFRDFNTVNYEYLRLLVEELIDCDAKPEHFLMISSLSVMGPGNEKSYAPIKPTDVPSPNTRYGLSKLLGEQFLRSVADFPFTIFRCTGVYGPHERDYFMMIKSIKRGFDFSVGFKKQMLTFIYVEDLACAIFDALATQANRKSYLISDPRGYTQKEFRSMVAEILHKRCVIPVKMPLWTVYMVSFFAEQWGIISMKPSTLNRDKYKIMRQRNWLCDISDAQRDFGFNPTHTLREGLTEAIEWYRSAKWL